MNLNLPNPFALDEEQQKEIMHIVAQASETLAPFKTEPQKQLALLHVLTCLTFGNLAYNNISIEARMKAARVFYSNLCDYIETPIDEELKKEIDNELKNQ